MIRILRGCVRTPLRSACTVVVVLLALYSAVFFYLVFIDQAFRFGTFCEDPDCPINQQWPYRKSRIIWASATAEAIDDQHTAVVETLEAHESVSATRPSATPISLTRVPTSGPTATATTPTREPTATATAVPPTATPLSVPTEVVPEPTSVVDAQVGTGQVVTAIPELETPTVETEPTVADATVQTTVTADYFDAYVEP